MSATSPGSPDLPPASSWRFLPVAGTFVAIAFAALVLAGSIPSNVDDGFIVLVYARHLAETGHVFWNAADGPVDGFTSILDVLVKAVSVWVAPGDLVRNAHVIALGGYFATASAGALLAYHAFEPFTKERWIEALLATLAAVSFAFQFALADATSYLLEGPLFALLALASVGTLVFTAPERRATRVALVILWTLLSLARPEGAALALVQAAWFAWAFGRERPTRERFAPGVALVILLLAYAAWHRLYFGALLPNTFYAKSSDSRWSEIVDGARYVKTYAGTHPSEAVLVACVFLLPVAALPRLRSLWSSDAARRRFACAASVALVLGIEVVVEGGDGYAGGRFLATPIALALLSLALGAAGLRARWRLVAAAPIAFVVVTGAMRGTRHFEPRLRRIASWPEHASDFSCEAAVTGAIAARASTVAQTDFQRLKFFRDDLRVIDLTGLNDRALAHTPSPEQNLWGKGGAAIGPASRAEVLQLGIQTIRPDPMARYSAARIARDEHLAKVYVGYPIPTVARDELAASYTTASFPVCGIYFNVFIRKDVAPRFADVALVH